MAWKHYRDRLSLEQVGVEARGSAAERCRREIAEIEALILAGHPDVQGLCQALADWSAELRLIVEAGQGDTPHVPRAI